MFREATELQEAGPHLVDPVARRRFQRRLTHLLGSFQRFTPRQRLQVLGAWNHLARRTGEMRFAPEQAALRPIDALLLVRDALVLALGDPEPDLLLFGGAARTLAGLPCPSDDLDFVVDLSIDPAKRNSQLQLISQALTGRAVVPRPKPSTSKEVGDPHIEVYTFDTPFGRVEIYSASGLRAADQRTELHLSRAVTYLVETSKGAIEVMTYAPDDIVASSRRAGREKDRPRIAYMEGWLTFRCGQRSPESTITTARGKVGASPSASSAARSTCSSGNDLVLSLGIP